MSNLKRPTQEELLSLSRRVDHFKDTKFGIGLVSHTDNPVIEMGILRVSEKGNYKVPKSDNHVRNLNYAFAAHGTQFGVKLINNYDRKARAVITMNGKLIGSYTVKPNYSWVVETKPGDGGRFTANLEGTSEAIAAGQYSSEKSKMGLIEITWDLEKKPVRDFLDIPVYKGLEKGGSLEVSMSAPNTRSTKRKSMQLGFSGKTNQKFKNDTFVQDYNFKSITMYIRFIPVSGSRPLDGLLKKFEPVSKPQKAITRIIPK